MRLLSVAVVGVVLVAVVVLGAEAERASAPSSGAISARESFRLENVFNFEHFKKLFGKQYKSLTEELARKKLFLARAFRAFLSKVGYKHHKAHSYLSVNQMSDWTSDEFKAIELSVEQSKADWAELAAKSADVRKQLEAIAELNALMGDQRPTTLSTVEVNAAESPTESDSLPALDEKVLESSLNEILAKQSDRPGYKEIAAELTSPSQANELAGDDTGKRVKLAKPASNNPDYQQPEVLSMGLGDAVEKVLPEWLLKMLKNLNGKQLIRKLINATVSKFFRWHVEEKLEMQPIVWDTDRTEHVDLRESNCFTPIKSQSMCGSCYIFSSMALFEFVHCKRTGQLVSFSEQYPLDCGERIGMRGCKGGSAFRVGEFVHEFGLELSANYPYRHMRFYCPYEPETEPKVMGYLKAKEGEMKLLPLLFIEKYLWQMPLIMDIYTPPNMQEYGGGVDPGDRCLESKGGHSMLLVGEGIEDGQSYWLLRNSWGPKWGERGHYKLSKEVNCFMAEFVQASGAYLFGDEFTSANADYEGAAVAKRGSRNMASLLLGQAKHSLLEAGKQGVKALKHIQLPSLSGRAKDGQEKELAGQ